MSRETLKAKIIEVLNEAASQAESRGKAGKWVFTVHAPSRLAVLTYADSRSLRERMYKAYMSIGSTGLTPCATVLQPTCLA